MKELQKCPHNNFCWGVVVGGFVCACLSVALFAMFMLFEVF